ncbi:MAG: TlpA family protein disulfide reductase, partial [Muribaculaceae bacterium]|nr:TlpA family protein disulfide reductase [Muribaculaceae bacterium]
MKKLVLLTCLLALVASSDVFAQLPAVTLKTIDGQEVKINELSNDGKPFIIDLFATWCKPCLRELDAIAEVYEDWQEETGVKIIAVSTDQAQHVH